MAVSKEEEEIIDDTEKKHLDVRKILNLFQFRSHCIYSALDHDLLLLN